MTANSKIEWTGRSDWNPIRGCTRKSQGCVNCYAEAIAGRFSDPGQPFHGFATRTAAGGRWTGKVEVRWDRLLLPLSWRKPAMIFANSTSDVFHEALPVEDIASIYAVAVAAYHLRGHTTQFLTKRPEKARVLLNDPAFWEAVNDYAGELVMERTDPLDRRSDDVRATLGSYDASNPPPGVWLGTSVEDRAVMLVRGSALKACPAAVRFWSAEPLLGDLGHLSKAILPDWVIVGGESGKGARDWPGLDDAMRSLRDHCKAAGVAFFAKQMAGPRKPLRPIPDDLMVREFPA